MDGYDKNYYMCVKIQKSRRMTPLFTVFNNSVNPLTRMGKITCLFPLIHHLCNILWYYTYITVIFNRPPTQKVCPPFLSILALYKEVAWSANASCLIGSCASKFSTVLCKSFSDHKASNSCLKGNLEINGTFNVVVFSVPSNSWSRIGRDAALQGDGLSLQNSHIFQHLDSTSKKEPCGTLNKLLEVWIGSLHFVELGMHARRGILG